MAFVILKENTTSEVIDSLESLQHFQTYMDQVLYLSLLVLSEVGSFHL